VTPHIPSRSSMKAVLVKAAELAADLFAGLVHRTPKELVIPRERCRGCLAGIITQNDSKMQDAMVLFACHLGVWCFRLAHNTLSVRSGPCAYLGGLSDSEN